MGQRGFTMVLGSVEGVPEGQGGRQKDPRDSRGTSGGPRGSKGMCRGSIGTCRGHWGSRRTSGMSQGVKRDVCPVGVPRVSTRRFDVSSGDL